MFFSFLWGGEVFMFFITDSLNLKLKSLESEHLGH
jgi:hypothetical protein